MNDLKDPILLELREQLNDFFFHIKQLFHQAKLEGTLTEGPSFLMHLLWLNGALKVSDLAKALGTTNGAVTQMADRLLEMGHIERERSEQDRRVVWLSLTPKGQEMVIRIQNNRYQHLRSRLETLSTDDLTKAVDIFQKLNSKLADRE